MSGHGVAPVFIGVLLECIKQEILLKLRWSILGVVDKIHMETGLLHDGSEKRHPFLSHPLAMESLTVPPVSGVEIYSADISEAMHFHLASEDYPYKSHTIENADGTPVTIKDFVVSVHNYLSQHRDILIDYRKAVGFNNKPPPPGAVIDPDSRLSYYTPSAHDLFFKRASTSGFLNP